MNYVPLWIKTDYSILSSLIKIDDLINKLASLNIKSCAIVDDDLYGTMEFYNKCLSNNIKPIIGLEVNLDFKVLLYAKNYIGYQNLCNINTLKNKNELTLEKLYFYLNDLLIVLPFKYKNYEEEFLKYTKDVYIGYDNNEEKYNIKSKKVYLKKTLCFDLKDEKYLPYLYMIKDEEYKKEKDVFLEYEISDEDKKTTILFSNLCDLVIPKKNNLLPVYNEKDNFDAKKYLTDLCILGLKKRFNNIVDKKYVERLKYELDVICNMGFYNYFLVVWDYVKYAKKNNILVGPGRGSAASSLVSYCLGITDIDPLKYDLLFERFLNPNRVTMPDIDIDFDAEKREDVINYVIDKYGKEKVCGIITFSNLLSKQVIRDIARIFKISNYKIDSLLNNFDDNKTLKEHLNNIIVRKMLNEDNELKKIYDISLHLEGLKRHISSHAAGIIISSEKLSDYIPLYVNSDGTYLSGYTMNYIEDLGLLKMDFLGLKNLSIIDKILNKVDIKFSDIPLDDKKTYDLFKTGALDGIFQFESSGMRKFIIELMPDKIDDLIAAVALFRPGPIDNIPLYVKRKHNKEKVSYIHKNLEGILSSTYGIIIYQEQIMQIASLMAGFSYAKADELRRAMSKKKMEVLLSYEEEFIKGSIKNGYDKNISKEVYDLILKFANYGFNKAHSVSYGIIGYKLAYLKANYPLEFMCEILNNFIGVKNKTKNIINECKKLNVKIIKPSINISSCYYEIKNNKLIYPLSMIREIGTLTARQIIEERYNNGIFTSYLDFVKRCYKLGKNVLKNLILSGALDEFKETRKTLIENLEDAINYAELCSDLDESLVIKPVLKEYDEYNLDELTKMEIDIFGFYMSNHPTNKYINDNSITTNILNNYFDKNIIITLYFERKKDINTKNNEKMMFITASDSYGSIELIMFPKIYNKYFNIVIPGIYEVKGKVEKRLSKLQIIINDVKKL